MWKEGLNQSLHDITSKALLMDVINDLIIDCINIKLLVNKPKESKYLQTFLQNTQIKYVHYSSIVPNVNILIMIIYWDPPFLSINLNQNKTENVCYLHPFRITKKLINIVYSVSILFI